MGAVVLETLKEALDTLAAGERGTVQEGEGTYESFFTDDDATLDFSRPAAELHRLVWAWRYPIPRGTLHGALAELDGETVRVLESSLDEVDGAMRVECADGAALARQDGAGTGGDSAGSSSVNSRTSGSRMTKSVLTTTQPAPKIRSAFRPMTARSARPARSPPAGTPSRPSSRTPRRARAFRRDRALDAVSHTTAPSENARPEAARRERAHDVGLEGEQDALDRGGRKSTRRRDEWAPGLECAGRRGRRATSRCPLR